MNVRPGAATSPTPSSGKWPRQAAPLSPVARRDLAEAAAARVHVAEATARPHPRAARAATAEIVRPHHVDAAACPRRRPAATDGDSSRPRRSHVLADAATTSQAPTNPIRHLRLSLCDADAASRPRWWLAASDGDSSRLRHSRVPEAALTISPAPNPPAPSRHSRAAAAVGRHPAAGGPGRLPPPMAAISSARTSPPIPISHLHLRDADAASRPRWWLAASDDHSSRLRHSRTSSLPLSSVVA